MSFKIDNVERVTIDGCFMKIVSVCAFINGVCFCLGDYKVPARCGDKKLIEYIGKNLS